MALRFHKASIPISIVFATVYFFYILNKVKGQMPEGMGIETKYKPDSCPQVVAEGDVVHIHYTIYSRAKGDKVDTTRQNPEPYVFKLGRCAEAGKPECLAGIKHAFIGMCVNEKRKITIPSEVEQLKKAKKKKGKRPAGEKATGPSGWPEKADKLDTLIMQVELVDLN